MPLCVYAIISNSKVFLNLDFLIMNYVDKKIVWYL